MSVFSENCRKSSAGQFSGVLTQTISPMIKFQSDLVFEILKSVVANQLITWCWFKHRILKQDMFGKLKDGNSYNGRPFYIGNKVPRTHDIVGIDRRTWIKLFPDKRQWKTAPRRNEKNWYGMTKEKKCDKTSLETCVPWKSETGRAYGDCGIHRNPQNGLLSNARSCIRWECSTETIWIMDSINS